MSVYVDSPISLVLMIQWQGSEYCFSKMIQYIHCKTQKKQPYFIKEVMDKLHYRAINKQHGYCKMSAKLTTMLLLSSTFLYLLCMTTAKREIHVNTLKKKFQYVHYFKKQTF